MQYLPGFGKCNVLHLIQNYLAVQGLRTDYPTSLGVVWFVSLFWQAMKPWSLNTGSKYSPCYTQMDLTALLFFTCKRSYGRNPTLWQISVVSSQTGILSRDMKFVGEQFSSDLHSRPGIRGINNESQYQKSFSRYQLRVSNPSSWWGQWSPAKRVFCCWWPWTSPEEQAGLDSMETHQKLEFLVPCRSGASAGAYRLDLDGKQEAPVWWKPTVSDKFPYMRNYKRIPISCYDFSKHSRCTVISETYFPLLDSFSSFLKDA